MKNRAYIETGIEQGVEWMRSRSPQPRGLIFVPPLIGGHALQQLRLLRWIRRWQLDVLSFSYSGHGGSKGTFSLGASLADGTKIMDMAVRQGLSETLPVYGLATCYAAIPLLHAAAEQGEPLAKVVLINAVPRWRIGSLVVSFLRYWRMQEAYRRLTPKGLFDAANAYLNDLFPGMRKQNDFFGTLSRRKTQLPRMIREFFVLRPLAAPALINTPVLCIYGCRDRLLHEVGWGNWPGYEAHIRRICPRTRFWTLDGDHYLVDNKLRVRVLREVIRFFMGRSTEKIPSPAGSLKARADNG